jgi:biotin carboxyl carrier protein
MKQTYQFQDKTFALDLTPTAKTWRATLGDKTVQVELLRAEAGRLDLLIDGSPVSAHVSLDGAKRWVTVDGQTLLLTKTGPARKNAAHDPHSAGQVLSPMPGQVRALHAAPEQAVTRGQTLLVVEAMKMEIKLAAPFDGRVKSVLVKVGQTVDKQQLLIEIEP